MSPRNFTEFYQKLLHHDYYLRLIFPNGTQKKIWPSSDHCSTTVCFNLGRCPSAIPHSTEVGQRDDREKCEINPQNACINHPTFRPASSRCGLRKGCPHPSTIPSREIAKKWKVAGQGDSGELKEERNGPPR